MSEAPSSDLPGLDEVGSWIGLGLDDIAGRAVGRVIGVYADAQSGSPVWLILAIEGRRRLPFGRRGTKRIAVPLRECATMPGRVWTAQGQKTMRDSPAVDPSRPLLREHEMAICVRYGIAERVGRHAEVVGRPAASITAQPV